MGVLENVEIPERRRFKIREDPFELSDRQFIQLFRLNKATVTNYKFLALAANVGNTAIINI